MCAHKKDRLFFLCIVTILNRLLFGLIATILERVHAVLNYCDHPPVVHCSYFISNYANIVFTIKKLLKTISVNVIFSMLKLNKKKFDLSLIVRCQLQQQISCWYINAVDGRAIRLAAATYTENGKEPWNCNRILMFVA